MKKLFNCLLKIYFLEENKWNNSRIIKRDVTDFTCKLYHNCALKTQLHLQKKWYGISSSLLFIKKQYHNWIWQSYEQGRWQYLKQWSIPLLYSDHSYYSCWSEQGNFHLSNEAEYSSIVHDLVHRFIFIISLNFLSIVYLN